VDGWGPIHNAQKSHQQALAGKARTPGNLKARANVNGERMVEAGSTNVSQAASHDCCSSYHQHTIPGQATTGVLAAGQCVRKMRRCGA